MRFKINDNFVGTGASCFIIAEAGVNHNGKISIAKKLVDTAKDAGANAIKFQTYKSEGVTNANVDVADYVKNNMSKQFRQIDLLKKYELKYENFSEIKEYCDKKNIIFLSTPHSFDAIDFLDDLVPAFKFGSGDITNIPALQHAARKGKPMILGTGMSTLEEVKYAVESIKKVGNHEIAALHCTTNYPCPYNHVNMRSMVTMQNKLDCLIGYSDHTQNSLISIMAVSLGACIIEKHFTLDKTLDGPDHKASLEPNEFKDMIQKIRDVEKAFGYPDKKPTSTELDIIEKVRKSIIANQTIEKNSIITQKMIGIKRPGFGIPPFKLQSIVGKKTIRKIKKDEIITEEMIE